MSQPNNMPYIKSEPDDFESLANGYNNFNGGFGNYQPTFNGGIDPSELSMSNGNSNQGFNFGGPAMSNNFMNGGSGTIHDDELLESLNSPSDMSNVHTNGMNVPRGQLNGAYSHTPEGAPIQSPFMGGFDYSQFRMGSISQHMSPDQSGAFMNKRPSMQAQRKSSNGQGMPMTPRTQAMAGLHLGSPDNMQQNGRAIQAPRHNKSLSGQFDSTSNSFNSYLDSPLASPNNHSHHPGISERMTSKHGSLPTKVDSVSAERVSQEDKKRRRRASHNAVERRRRDNINDRIHDLSQLVPGHRLDDDRVKKQLASNGPLSPTIDATNMSPTNAATSLLAGANGRRAASTAGNITLGLPIDEKEKGPNKGDILNGSVAWTRDLMWALYHKYQQEDELASYISSIGGTWPYEISEDDKRMRSEVMAAVDKNDPSNFAYSRYDGSGLRVPQYTNIQGDRLTSNASSLSPQSNLELSPAFHSGGSGTGSGNQPQFWHSAGHAGLSFKEEDELMELNSA